MATLRQRAGSDDVVLYPEHTLGRSKSCSLQVAHPRVSALHAVIFWADEAWFIKDLGSRNGTLVDGRRLAAGVRVQLARGAELELGSGGPSFELTDEQAPRPLLVAADDPGFYRWITETSLVLPNEECPEALLYLAESGAWHLESETGVVRIEEHGLFTLGERLFRLIASPGVPATAATRDPLTLAEASLKFSVSSDEEHVELTVDARGRSWSLGHRAHHYLLLTLARARKTEKSSGSPGSDGWIDRQELERMLRQTQQHVNLAVWRARRQFAEAGFYDAANLVERRGSELRLGARSVEIVRG